MVEPHGRYAFSVRVRLKGASVGDAGELIHLTADRVEITPSGCLGGWYTNSNGVEILAWSFSAGEWHSQFAANALTGDPVSWAGGDADIPRP